MVKLVNQTIFHSRIKEKGILIFSAPDVCGIFGVSKVAAIGLLHRYSAKKIIVKLKRGLYALSDASLPEPYVANRIYSPSYVSLEFALSYHGVIPETVYEITSVTTKAPRRFEALGRIFSYRKIKKSAFSGYGVEKQNNLGFYIADAQKAFVDANYFRWFEKLPPISRFNKEKIDIETVKNYARLFGKGDFENFIKKSLQ